MWKEREAREGVGVWKEALEPRMGSSGLGSQRHLQEGDLAGRQMTLGMTPVMTKCPAIPQHGPWAPDEAGCALYVMESSHRFCDIGFAVPIF